MATFKTGSASSTSSASSTGSKVAEDLGTGGCDGSTDPLPLPEVANADGLARLSWALAHPARVRIVRLLLQRKSCLCGEIVAEMPLAQSTVSQHLKILKDTGLVQGEIDPPRVCYCINPSALAQLKQWIADL
jgi:ArsR family transcriptional regulator